MNYLIQQALAVVLFLFLLPLLIVLYVFCAVLNGVPVFFRGERQGLHKKLFLIWKFRTMQPDFQDPSNVFSDEGKLLWKHPGDPRITAAGHFLRRFSLDELPQLWNVIKGDMALVGPRPIIEEEDQLYGKYSTLLHSVKPGMTGLWQVSGRCLTTYHRRIAINRYYVTHRSWRLDLWILWKTAGAVVSGRGAY